MYILKVTVIFIYYENCIVPARTKTTKLSARRHPLDQRCKYTFACDRKVSKHIAGVSEFKDGGQRK
jgi:hypothetical protein